MTMGAMFETGNETIREEEMEKMADEVLILLKTKKRTYQMNKSILKYAIDKLEREANTIIFQ